MEENNYSISNEDLEYIKSINKPFSQTLWNDAKGNLKRYLFNFVGTWKHYCWEDSEWLEKWQSSPEVRRWKTILNQIKWDNKNKKVIDTRSEEDKKLTFYEMYNKLEQEEKEATYNAE